MKKVLLLTACLIVGGLSVFGQKVPFSTAAGVRFLGGTNSAIGITYKHYTNPTRSYEFIALLGSGLFDLSGYYQYNGILPDVPPSFRYVLGVGAHVGYQSYGGYYNNSNNTYYTYSGVAAGFNGMIGAEYTFKEIPLNLGVDFIPGFHVITNSAFDVHTFLGVGVSARYVFK